MSVFDTPSRILVACAPGIPPYLKTEVAALGFPVLTEQRAGVETEGTAADAMRLNLYLRTAQRVLYQVAGFPAQTAEHLYRHVNRLPWEEYLPAETYLSVDSFVKTPAIRDSRFANLKCKDAIVDRMRAACGRRPDSGNARRGAVVFLFWNERDCRVYLDTSGETLVRRGYRKIPMDAPLQEPLAAALIMATGWSGSEHFVNPMCGSGTLAIEAALLGLGRAPGLLRSPYGFRHLKGFDETAWQALRQAARAQPKRPLGGRIVATDLRPEAVRAAEQNAETAGVRHLIEFGGGDFAATPVPEGSGVVILNPEYGERMGHTVDLAAVYRRIGDFLKQRCQGYRGFVFTGNLELGKQIGLRARRRGTFFNSRIECRLLAFDLYAGSLRRRGSAVSGG